MKTTPFHRFAVWSHLVCWLQCEWACDPLCDSHTNNDTLCAAVTPPPPLWNPSMENVKSAQSHCGCSFVLWFVNCNLPAICKCSHWTRITIQCPCACLSVTICVQTYTLLNSLLIKNVFCEQSPSHRFLFVLFDLCRLISFCGAFQINLSELLPGIFLFFASCRSDVGKKTESTFWTQSQIKWPVCYVAFCRMQS